MKTFLKSLLIAPAILWGCTKDTPPAEVLPVPTKAQIEWQKMETYAFIHFGLNTFNDLEWGFGDTPSSTFDPENLDTEQWVKIIKAAGFKGVILTAKHHDGFCLWQTKHGDYSVKNSPWRDGKGDVVKELIESCKKHNLKIGLYLSPWDRNHAKYGYPEYTEYFQNQITELINEYCNDIDMFEYWFDGANGGDGYYGGTREKRSIDPNTYYQYERAVETIHDKFPDAMIFGGTSPTIRWVGNESGFAGETNWANYRDGLHYMTGHWGVMDGEKWEPAECDVSIRPGWFYHPGEDHAVHSLSHLVDLYYKSVGRNSNLLMNFPVALKGQIHPIDSARIMEWRKILDEELKTNLLAEANVNSSSDRGRGYKATTTKDGDYDTYWATEDGVKEGSLTYTFKKPTKLNRLMIQEYIPLGQRVMEFSVDYKKGGEWRPIITDDSMTTIGYKRIIRFETADAEAIRINFLRSRGELTINNVEAFMAPALMVEPAISRDKNGLLSITAGDKSAKIFYTTNGSEPTKESTVFTEPIKTEDKISVKAIAWDPVFDKYSPVSMQNYDILTSDFQVTNIKDEKTSLIFDSNPYTAFYLPKGLKELSFTTPKVLKITGLTYTPDQNRWGGGYISSYEIWSEGKMIKKGEFSNIKANPIEQIIKFETPIESNSIKLVVKSIVDNNDSAGISEIGLLTE